MGRIRYVAIVSQDPAGLADWYAATFGTAVIGRNDAGDVSITDGYVNLSLLEQRPGEGGRAELGLHQHGVEVEARGAVGARLGGVSQSARMDAEPGGLLHGE